MPADILRRADSHPFAATRALCLGCLLLAGPFAAGSLHAQAATASAQTGSVHKASSRQARSSAKAHKRAKPAQAKTPPATPPEPPRPNWPVNSAAVPATITWDSRGLGIKAANSSLQQILEDVATATGTVVEGTVPDPRVFGTYGPGPARDVLFHLLQGSGYNVLMIGDRKNGAPSRLVLTARSKPGPQTPVSQFAQNESREDEPAESEPQEPPVQPAPQPMERPGPGTPMPPVPPNIQQMRQMQQRMSQPNP